MSPASRSSLFVAGAAAAIAALATSTFLCAKYSSESKVGGDDEIRAKLPHDLQTWRLPGDDEEVENEIWNSLHRFFLEQGYTLWAHEWDVSLIPPEPETTSNAFLYVTSLRGLGKFYKYHRWEYMNPISRAARARSGQDVIVRVVAIGEQGQRHLNILRKVARGHQSLFADNHALPMLDELAFHDVVFAVFPKASLTLDLAYSSWAQNSAGDIINMIMQVLEGLAYLHSVGIAHRDVFKSNIMVEWMPESLLVGRPPVSHPRVYLIDFECAIDFPADCPEGQRHCVGLPIGDTMTTEGYLRPVPAEVAVGMPYDPFKLDVWQLGTSFSDFKSTIAPIDKILDTMAVRELSFCPTAASVLQSLGRVVESMAPNELLVKADCPE
ncbi:kinase-like domain-containing protein [Phanerochaete sordida]|uniref:Kinase-like domain-containing protein n=1 Tax=Phanerochaete sordida TaxID=48140 RepID=A0A9P3L927_9APHY|nr:kinase-like domain-containing protein [Phanerochaete sordida]